jgi:hypothetical protein
LRRLLHSYRVFDFELAEIQEFPGVLYLAPNPDVYFRQLTEGVVAQFPAYPPYAGAVPEPTPHLTVGQPSDPQAFNRLRAAFARRARDQLPVPARAEEVALLNNSSGRWRLQKSFGLGN